MSALDLLRHSLMTAPLVAVIRAFHQCAVAEIVVRFAARLYTDDIEARAELLEEWLAELELMTPSERLTNAGSWLWAGTRQLLSRTWVRRKTAAAFRAEEQNARQMERNAAQATNLLFAVVLLGLLLLIERPGMANPD